jgi:thioredoxin-like negative regulator of GroEL
MPAHPPLQNRANPSQDFAGSRVAPATVDQLQTLQRRSFGHRNLRTYVVVVADPRSAACRAVENSIEQLASGLVHERAVVVMALDTADPAAAQFAARILSIGSLPAVLVYPEGAPGFLAYKGE